MKVDTSGLKAYNKEDYESLNNRGITMPVCAPACNDLYLLKERIVL